MSLGPIADQLKSLVVQSEIKLAELVRREENLRSKEAALNLRQEAFEKKVSEHTIREEKLSHIESFIEMEKTARKLWQDAQNMAEDVRQDKEKFEIYKEGELKQIGVQLRSIADEWKKLRG